MEVIVVQKHLRKDVLNVILMARVQFVMLATTTKMLSVLSVVMVKLALPDLQVFSIVY